MTIRWADGEEERLKIPENPCYVEYNTKSGNSYYWNSVTGLTQWNRPHSSYIIPADQSVQSNDLFVFYLPVEWTEEDLYMNFQKFGSIVNAKVAMDKNTGKSKGFAFVSYENSASAANAIKSMNGFAVLGKRLKVQYKKNDNK